MMARRSVTQLGLLAIGLVFWGYGVRVDDSRVRWVGIAFFAASAALWLLRDRHRDEGGEAEP